MQTMKVELAIPNIPIQTWGETYQEESALCKGTIFPDLNKPFFLADDFAAETGAKSGTGKQQGGDILGKGDQQEREMLMAKISEVSFLLDDLNLYLDTHGEEKAACKLFMEKGQERKQLLADFARRFYPLTRDCIPDGQGPEPENLWAKGPMPWEGACV